MSWNLSLSASAQKTPGRGFAHTSTHSDGYRNESINESLSAQMLEMKSWWGKLNKVPSVSVK